MFKILTYISGGAMVLGLFLGISYFQYRKENHAKALYYGKLAIPLIVIAIIASIWATFIR